MMSTNNYLYLALIVLFWQSSITETSENLALNKVTSQSSDFNSKYPSSKAVDGSLSSEFYEFAHTDFNQNEWWRVDLGNEYEIKKIQIYYRNSHIQRMDGYSLNISTSLNPLDTWLCFKDTIDGYPTDPNPNHICRHLGRYVTFSRYQTTGDKGVINLCELEVYGCQKGRFGNQNCNLNCSIGCFATRCDPDNETCDCKSGWSGSTCTNCMDGYFGDTCTDHCSGGCNNNVCKKDNGHCTNGCTDAFYGEFCNKSCSANCKYNKCTRQTGDCLDGCRNDNFLSNKCIECVDGYFGYTCSTPCFDGCANNVCNEVNGYCIRGCKDALYGDFCNQSCTANCKNNRCTRQTGDCSERCRSGNFLGNKCHVCVDGLYGNNCDQECPSNCKHGMCHGTDGSCIFGCIYSNMTGNQCDGAEEKLSMKTKKL